MKEKKYKNNPRIAVILVAITAIFTGLISLQTSASAAIYKANSNKRINIEISQTGVNRIEVKKDRIAKVIGNIDEYSIEGDSKTGAIFLSIKVMAGEIVPITIITHLTHDANFSNY